MKALISIIILAFSVNIFACEDQLISALGKARSAVVKNFPAKTPCYNAAMIGRTKGPPGCFPPEAFQLRDLLTPILTSAQDICKKVCSKISKKNSCLNFIKNSNLKANGIDNLVNQLKNQGLPVDASFEYQEESAPILEI
jgi:hypothetical protein